MKLQSNRFFLYPCVLLWALAVLPCTAEARSLPQADVAQSLFASTLDNGNDELLRDDFRTAGSSFKWFPDSETGLTTVTYSYSNLLDGALGISDDMLRAAVEEGLGLWSKFAPIHFVEVEDYGLSPADKNYPTDMNYYHSLAADIRIGHHLIDGNNNGQPHVLAHAFYPSTSWDLPGDVHFDDGDPWRIDPSDGVYDFLYTFTHEVGHSLGLAHEPLPADGGNVAIMNPNYKFNLYSGLGTAFLYEDDINGIQAIYGTGTGSVTPLNVIPEPSGMALLLAGLACAALARRRRGH